MRKIAVLTLVLLAAAGCSDNQNNDTRGATGPKLATSLQEMFGQALKRPGLSDFERSTITQAIKTGKISQTDYEDAHSRYAQCMKDSGVNETYTKLSSGLYEIHPPLLTTQDAGEHYKTVSDKCFDGMFTVEILYQTQQTNPELLADQYELVTRCLVKAGVAPADYSAVSFQADLKGNFSKAPYQVSNVRAHECLWSAGFAIVSGT